MNDIIRRKVARAAAAGSDGGPGADQGWRLAFARAARDGTGLLVEVAAMTLHRRSLAELLELPPDRALMVLLDGPQGGLGLMVMSPEVMGALIEMQTTARVSAAPTLTRRPTRTDAAMVAGVIDRALEELEVVLAEEADLVWAGGFRYASFDGRVVVRVAPHRKDGTYGPREIILGLVHSKYLAAWANPVVASINFAFSLVIFYYTPLFLSLIHI